MQNQNMGGGNYRNVVQAPPQQFQQPEEEEEDKFERKGDFYQCVKCEEYTVHVKNDKYCENSKCSSNSKAQYMQKQPKGTSTPHRGGVAAPNKSGYSATTPKPSGAGVPAKKYPPKSQCLNCSTALTYKTKIEIQQFQGLCPNCFRKSRAVQQSAASSQQQVMKITCTHCQQKNHASSKVC